MARVGTVMLHVAVPEVTGAEQSVWPKRVKLTSPVGVVVALVTVPVNCSCCPWSMLVRETESVVVVAAFCRVTAWAEDCQAAW